MPQMKFFWKNLPFKQAAVTSRPQRTPPYVQKHVIPARLVPQAVVKAKEMAKFRHQELQNPWTDVDETWDIELCWRYDHTRKSTWRCYNAGGLGKHGTWHMFRFLTFFLFLTLYFAQPAPVYRFWRPIRHMTCFRARKCLLGVAMRQIRSSPFRGQPPPLQKWGK